MGLQDSNDTSKVAFITYYSWFWCNRNGVCFFYNDLGVDVTIIESLPSILPNEDSDISKIVKENFEKRGIKIKTNATLKAVTVKQTQFQRKFLLMEK